MMALQALSVFAALAARVSAQVNTVTITTSGPTANPSVSSAISSILSSLTARTSETASSSSGPATVTIAVGAKGPTFTPNDTKANVGDTIKFNFYPGGHRVVRSTFAWPCIPYEYVEINGEGFDSGARYPQVVSDDPPTFEITINNTDPLFYYCAAPHSCVDYHMIGVINGNSTENFTAQMAYAKNVAYQLAPGEPFPSETGISRPTPSPTAGPGPGPNPPGGNGGGGGGGLSGGAIAGIVIASAAVLVAAAALIYLCGRRGGFDKAYRKSGLPGSRKSASTGSPGMVEANYPNAGPGGVGGVAGGVPGVGGNIKSPGEHTTSAFGGHDAAGLRNSGYYAPGMAPSPGPGGLPAYGQPLVYAYGHSPEEFYHSDQGSPRADRHSPFFSPPPPPPAELPTDHPPVPEHSPPPGYQGRESWSPEPGVRYR